MHDSNEISASAISANNRDVGRAALLNTELVMQWITAEQQAEPVFYAAETLRSQATAVSARDATGRSGARLKANGSGEPKHQQRMDADPQVPRVTKSSLDPAD